MKTTVILPIYNGQEFLEETLTSVYAQTVPCNLIAINDGSTDDTLTILKAHEAAGKLHLITQENKKIGAALNAGIAACQTEYYLPFSADDILYPDYIEKVEQIFDSEQLIDIVVTQMQVFGQGNYIWKPEGLFNKLYQTNTMFFSSTIKKTLWTKLGGYSEVMPFTGMEDWDFWVRALEAQATAWTINEPLIKYRTHPSQVTHTVLEPNGHANAIWMYEHGRMK